MSPAWPLARSRPTGLQTVGSVGRAMVAAVVADLGHREAQAPQHPWVRRLPLRRYLNAPPPHPRPARPARSARLDRAHGDRRGHLRTPSQSAPHNRDPAEDQNEARPAPRREGDKARARGGWALLPVMLCCPNRLLTRLAFGHTGGGGAVRPRHRDHDHLLGVQPVASITPTGTGFHNATAAGRTGIRSVAARLARRFGIGSGHLTVSRRALWRRRLVEIEDAPPTLAGGALQPHGGWGLLRAGGGSSARFDQRAKAARRNWRSLRLFRFSRLSAAGSVLLGHVAYPNPCAGRRPPTLRSSKVCAPDDRL